MQSIMLDQILSISVLVVYSLLDILRFLVGGGNSSVPSRWDNSGAPWNELIQLRKEAENNRS